MKENYKSWKVDIKNFKEIQDKRDKLKFLLNFAILAPSSHNSQPWSFKINNDEINIYKESSRRLSIGDKNDRQLFLSIGTAIENLCTAADYFNFSFKIVYASEIANDNLIATVKFTGQNSILKDDKDHLIHSILKRKTNRSKYKTDKISEKILNEIKSFENENLKIFILSEKEILEKLANVAVLSSIESMVDSEFRKELSHHIKHNLTKSKVGMPGFTLGVPTFISFILPSMIKRLNMEKISQSQNEILLKKYTPYIVVISTKEDTYKDWVNAGQIFEKIALLTTKYNISLSPLGAPIQIGNFFENIQDILRDYYRPQMFFRMGYATKEVAHSPRLNVNDVIKN